MRLPAALLAFGLIALPQSALGQSSFQKHFEAIAWEKYQDEAVRLLQEYLRIDTSNPPGNEMKAAEFFKRLFDEAGIPNTVFPYAPGRANIVAILTMVLLNHMDVVHADPKSWRVPPFAGEIVNGELYGRGALDMKDEGLLQAMVLIIAWREHLPLKRDLIFLATSDEEVDDTGSAWIIANHPELVQHAEYLITEGGSNLIYPGPKVIYGIGAAEKAPFWIRMVAHGRGGHGSIPIADSAPNRLARAMCRVVNWQTPVHLLPQVEEYFRQIATLENEPRARQFREIRRSLEDSAFVREITADERYNYLLRDTVSLTVLKGGPQTNVIPDTASCDLDIRLLPGEDRQAFLAELRSVVADDHVELVPINIFRPPNSSPITTPLYRTIVQVVHEYTPHALVAPVLNGGYTECQMYRPLGINSYGFMPIELTPEVEETEHAPNERIPIDQLRRGLKMLYEVVGRMEIQ